MSPQIEKNFRIGKAQISLLEELTNAFGVSGDEAKIREIIRKR